MSNGELIASADDFNIDSLFFFFLFPFFFFFYFYFYFYYSLIDIFPLRILFLLLSRPGDRLQLRVRRILKVCNSPLCQYCNTNTMSSLRISPEAEAGYEMLDDPTNLGKANVDVDIVSQDVLLNSGEGNDILAQEDVDPALNAKMHIVNNVRSIILQLIANWHSRGS